MSGEKMVYFWTGGGLWRLKQDCFGAGLICISQDRSKLHVRKCKCGAI